MRCADHLGVDHHPTCSPAGQADRSAVMSRCRTGLPRAMTGLLLSHAELLHGTAGDGARRPLLQRQIRARSGDDGARARRALARSSGPVVERHGNRVRPIDARHGAAGARRPDAVAVAEVVDQGMSGVRGQNVEHCAFAVPGKTVTVSSPSSGRRAWDGPVGAARRRARDALEGGRDTL